MKRKKIRTEKRGKRREERRNILSRPIQFNHLWIRLHKGRVDLRGVVDVPHSHIVCAHCRHGAIRSTHTKLYPLWQLINCRPVGCHGRAVEVVLTPLVVHSQTSLIFIFHDFSEQIIPVFDRNRCAVC
jgi:hypothetical protein